MFDPVFQIKNKGRKRRREEEISDSLIHSSFQQKEKREKQRERKERREIVPTRRKQHSVQYGMVVVQYGSMVQYGRPCTYSRHSGRQKTKITTMASAALTKAATTASRAAVKAAAKSSSSSRSLATRVDLLAGHG